MRKRIQAKMTANAKKNPAETVIKATAGKSSWEHRRDREADWAKIPDSLVDRALEASRRVGRRAPFGEFAAEFTLGPEASAESKLELQKKLERIPAHNTRHHAAKLKEAINNARATQRPNR
jgi:hypothetical protein